MEHFFFFFLSLTLSFKIIFFGVIASSVSFDSHVRTQKTDITRASYELFDLLRFSCVCSPQLWRNLAFSFISLYLSFKVMIFLFHIKASSVSFDSHVSAQKSDITRATYELFDLLRFSYVCLPQLWHNFAFSFEVGCHARRNGILA